MLSQQVNPAAEQSAISRTLKKDTSVLETKMCLSNTISHPYHLSRDFVPSFCLHSLSPCDEIVKSLGSSH